MVGPACEAIQGFWFFIRVIRVSDIQKVLRQFELKQRAFPDFLYWGAASTDQHSIFNTVLHTETVLLLRLRAWLGSYSQAWSSVCCLDRQSSWVWVICMFFHTSVYYPDYLQHGPTMAGATASSWISFFLSGSLDHLE